MPPQRAEHVEEGVHPRRARPHEPVAEPHCPLDGGLGAPPKPDRRVRLLHRLRPQRQAVDPPLPVVEADFILGPETFDELQRVGETADAPGRVDAEDGVPRLVPAQADPKDQPARRELVDAGRDLGDVQRVEEWEDDDRDAELHPRRRRSRCRQQDEGVERRAEHAVLHPEAVVAQGLGSCRMAADERGVGGPVEERLGNRDAGLGTSPDDHAFFLPHGSPFSSPSSPGRGPE